MRMFQECLYEPTTVATIGDDLTTSFVSNSVFLILFDETPASLFLGNTWSFPPLTIKLTTLEERFICLIHNV